MIIDFDTLNYSVATEAQGKAGLKDDKIECVISSDILQVVVGTHDFQIDGHTIIAVYAEDDGYLIIDYDAPGLDTMILWIIILGTMFGVFGVLFFMFIRRSGLRKAKEKLKIKK